MSSSIWAYPPKLTKFWQVYKASYILFIGVTRHPCHGCALCCFLWKSSPVLPSSNLQEENGGFVHLVKTCWSIAGKPLKIIHVMSPAWSKTLQPLIIKWAWGKNQKHWALPLPAALLLLIFWNRGREEEGDGLTSKAEFEGIKGLFYQWELGQGAFGDLSLLFGQPWIVHSRWWRSKWVEDECFLLYNP